MRGAFSHAPHPHRNHSHTRTARHRGAAELWDANQRRGLRFPAEHGQTEERDRQREREEVRLGEEEEEEEEKGGEKKMKGAIPISVDLIKTGLNRWGKMEGSPAGDGSSVWVLLCCFFSFFILFFFFF